VVSSSCTRLILHERLAPPAERVTRALVACAVTACAAGVVSALLPGSLMTAAWIGAAGAVFLLGGVPFTYTRRGERVSPSGE
jgi:hypothetical protein